RIQPTLVLIPHHVTVHASLRIVGHVGRAAGVAERKQPDPEERPEQNREQQGRNPHTADCTTAGHRKMGKFEGTTLVKFVFLLAVVGTALAAPPATVLTKAGPVRTETISLKELSPAA